MVGGGEEWKKTDTSEGAYIFSQRGFFVNNTFIYDPKSKTPFEISESLRVYIERVSK
jgi:hypothetical protein